MLTLFTVMLLIAIQSDPAADPQAKADALIEGRVNPAKFDYGAVRFSPDEKAAWQALEALDNYAQTFLADSSKHEGATPKAKPGKSLCDVWAILAGIRQAKLANNYDQYDRARSRAGKLISELEPGLKTEAETAGENIKTADGRRIAKLLVFDQGWRRPMGEIAQRGDLSSYEKEFIQTALLNQACKADELSTAFLEDRLQEIGWFTISEYGERIDRGAWLLAQHGDLDLQEKILARLTPLVETGETDPRNYAMLYDRVQVRRGKPQRYGSQGECQSGYWVPAEIENRERVNELRRAMNMISFEKNKARLDAQCP